MPWAKRIGGLLCAAVTGCLTLQPVPGHAALIDLVEDFGNFPDAVAVTGQFGDFTGLNINGDTITATGILLNVANESFGDGMHDRFENNPDGDFATDDVLTAVDAAAIDAAQPFGIFSVTAHLPPALITPATIALASGPAQFDVRTEGDEVIFEIIPPTDGVVFDPALAPPPPGQINAVFTNPEFGVVSFFFGLPAGTPFSAIVMSTGFDASTELAWHDATVMGGVQTMLLNRRFRPRGQVEGVAVVPVPAALPLFLSALAGLGFMGWRRRRAA